MAGWLAHIKDWISHHESELLAAARVGISATLAYGIALFQHIPEPYWPVMTAIIVARGSRGGGSTAMDRLIGTLAGAALGLGASFGRHIAIPDWALLFLAVTPLAFFSTPALRAAPMAAMIVLSASSAGSGSHGVAVAVLRTLDVGMGTLVALFVSFVLFPSHPVRALRRDAADAMKRLANLLYLAARGKDPEAREKYGRLSLKARKELRDITIAARGIRAKRAEKDLPETPANRLAASLSRMQTTIQFINRALRDEDASIWEALQPFIGATRARLEMIGEALCAHEKPAADNALDEKLQITLERIANYGKDNPGAHREALPFLFAALRDDLNELAAAGIDLVT